jgi:hypothetical protein
MKDAIINVVFDLRIMSLCFLLSQVVALAASVAQSQ